MKLPGDANLPAGLTSAHVGSDAPVAFSCDCCGEDIYAGDDYVQFPYKHFDHRVCRECIENHWREAELEEDLGDE